MARRAVGLDIGSRCVKVAELVREAGGAHLTKWAVQEILDPSPAGKAQAVVRALRSAGIAQRRVVCSVSRADATVKRINVPTTDWETTRKVLSFEAQQHVPFPLREVAWDFDLAGAGGSVLLVAARRGLIDDLRAILAQAGLKPVAVSVTSVAAAHAYLQSGGLSREESGYASVLIELGAGAVIVNVLRAGSLHLSRPLPISGDDLTGAFARDLGCDAKAAQEARRARGMAALPANAGRVAEWMRALRAEVERSLLAAAEGEASLSVEEVVVTGGGWETPGLVAALASVLGAPVSTFPPEGKEASPILGATIGLALQGLGVFRGANLLAAAAARVQKTSRRRIASAVAAAALLAALGLGTWRYVAVQSQSLAMQPALARGAQRERQTKALLARERSLKARVAELQGLLNQRGEVLDTLKLLSEEAPAGVWLTSISYLPGRPVTVQGKAVSANLVPRLLDSLGNRAALTYVKQSDKSVDFALAIEAGVGG